jgi:hypothetical protein
MMFSMAQLPTRIVMPRSSTSQQCGLPDLAARPTPLMVRLENQALASLDPTGAFADKVAA